jgi:hypothetical protein
MSDLLVHIQSINPWYFAAGIAVFLICSFLEGLHE